MSQLANAALHDDDEYAAAIDEVEELMLSEPDTPAGRRFDELVALIEDFDARRDRYATPKRHDAA